VPTLTALVSIGCFIPALAGGGGKEEPKPPSASR